MTFKTSVDQVCEELGVLKDRRVISTKGRHGVIQGVEYNINNKGAVWVKLDDDQMIRVPRIKFKVTPKS